MRRVSVVGVSGAGKSTLARRLAARLDVPHVELDAIYHGPNWTPLPTEKFRARVESLACEDGWVIDGNYRAVLPVIWQRADTVVWVDPSRATVMGRLVWRTLCRALLRTELWNGNRERWRNLFTADPDRSVIVWAWTSYSKYRARYSRAMSDPRWGHLTFLRISAARASSERVTEV